MISEADFRRLESATADLLENEPINIDLAAARHGLGPVEGLILAEVHADRQGAGDRQPCHPHRPADSRGGWLTGLSRTSERLGCQLLPTLRLQDAAASRIRANHAGQGLRAAPA